MTTIALELPGTERRWFYVGMAGLFVLVAFVGFTPTYWSKLAGGSFKGAPITHIHGALFFAWTLFFFVQTALVASGRPLRHRDWGLAGISLATAMAISVVLAAINSIKVAQGLGMADEARRFSIVSLASVVLFSAFVGIAIANVRRAEVHKRLMFLAMVPLMHAAMARLFMPVFAPPRRDRPAAGFCFDSAGIVRRPGDRRRHRLRLAYPRPSAPGLSLGRCHPCDRAVGERSDRRQRGLAGDRTLGRIAGGISGPANGLRPYASALG